MASFKRDSHVNIAQSYMITQFAPIALHIPLYSLLDLLIQKSSQSVTSSLNPPSSNDSVNTILLVCGSKSEFILSLQAEFDYLTLLRRCASHVANNGPYRPDLGLLHDYDDIHESKEISTLRALDGESLARPLTLLELAGSSHIRIVFSSSVLSTRAWLNVFPHTLTNHRLSQLQSQNSNLGKGKIGLVVLNLIRQHAVSTTISWSAQSLSRTLATVIETSVLARCTRLMLVESLVLPSGLNFDNEFLNLELSDREDHCRLDGSCHEKEEAREIEYPEVQNNEMVLYPEYTLPRDSSDVIEGCMNQQVPSDPTDEGLNLVGYYHSDVLGQAATQSVVPDLLLHPQSPFRRGSNVLGTVGNSRGDKPSESVSVKQSDNPIVALPTLPIPWDALLPVLDSSVRRKLNASLNLSGPNPSGARIEPNHNPQEGHHHHTHTNEGLLDYKDIDHQFADTFFRPRQDWANDLGKSEIGLSSPLKGLGTNTTTTTTTVQRKVETAHVSVSQVVSRWFEVSRPIGQDGDECLGDDLQLDAVGRSLDDSTRQARVRLKELANGRRRAEEILKTM